jgi:hypothetical protein
MLGYLSKFVLQMLPTISATVIGAYIVSTWINPKTPPEPAKVTAQAQPAAKVPVAEPPAEEVAATAAESKPADIQPAHVQSTDVKAVETPEGGKPVKAAKGPDNIRIIPIVRTSAPSADLPAAASASVVAPETAAVSDERKDANELARAAIQRLRGGAESARGPEEPAKPAAATVRVQQVRTTVEAPQALPAATLVSAPPLPPAVAISAPRYPQGDAADPASLTQPDRPSPPGEIPTTRAPLNLQASHRVVENPSLADDFLSATKSFFRAITPQER